MRWASGARTHDRRIMRSTASCTMRASCTDGAGYRTGGSCCAGISGAPVHEPVHAGDSQYSMAVTQRDMINIRRTVLKGHPARRPAVSKCPLNPGRYVS